MEFFFVSCGWLALMLGGALLLDKLVDWAFDHMGLVRRSKAHQRLQKALDKATGQ